MATISLCMIVKDEEAVLERCLTSVLPAVDEIIIADTGSRDHTREIAVKYAHKLLEVPWEDNFAAARNASFSQAAGEYLMWLDADDVILPEDLAKLLQLKERLDGTQDVVMLPYHTAFDEAGRPVFTCYRERILRRSLPQHWEGRVHEVIVHEGRLSYADAAVTHRSIKTEYSNRNLRIYEKQRALGEAFTPRDLFYYGRELYYNKRYKDAEKVLNAFLQENGWDADQAEAYKFLAYIYEILQMPEKRLDALLHALRLGMPRAEICCELGRFWTEKGEYTAALFWYQTAMKLPVDTQGFIALDAYRFLPALGSCVCYDRLGDHKKAALYNQIAGRYRPESPEYLQNLEYFSSLCPNPCAADGIYC